MTTAARVMAWLVFFAEAFVTVSPRSLRPHTGLEHNLEHFLALACLGVLFGLAYPQRWRVVAAVGPVAAGLLELAQLWRPGRHASLMDFEVNVLGLWAGLMAAMALQWLWRRRFAARRQRA